VDERVNSVQQNFAKILKKQTELKKVGLKTQLNSHKISPFRGRPPSLESETFFLVKLLKEIVDLLNELKEENVDS
jgi:hypothetical protein